MNTSTHLGSVLLINGEQNKNYIPAIQHGRRRETIAMTPANCLIALKSFIGKSSFDYNKGKVESEKALVSDSIADISGTNTKSLVGSSGLSIQYAIMMGLIHDAFENY